jgi:hypothetical protein
VIPADAVAFPLEDSLVVARQGLHCLFLLNATARMVWEDLSSGISRSEVAVRLSESFGIPAERAGRDVEAAIESWRSRGLLGDIPPAPSQPRPAAPAPPNATGRSFAEERHYAFLEKNFRIRFADPGLLAEIHPRYANLETPVNDGADPAFDLERDGEECLLSMGGCEKLRHPSPGAIRHRLFFELLELAHSPLTLMAWLHAGAVSDRSRTIVLPGKERSGKSTLTAALTHSGLTCHGDDRVFLDFPSRRALATPNAVTLKEGGWSVLASRFPSLETLPVILQDGENIRFLAMPPPDSRFLPPVACLIFPRYAPAALSALDPITVTEALERIVGAHSWICPEHARLAAFLEWLRTVPAYDLPFSSLDTAVSLIHNRLAP